MIKAFCGLKHGRSCFDDLLIFYEEMKYYANFWFGFLYQEGIRRGEGNIAKRVGIRFAIMDASFLNGMWVVSDDSVRAKVEKCIEDLLGKFAWLCVELTAAVGEKDD